MRTPERIYLQVSPEDVEEPQDLDSGEVTWCEDRQNDSDVEYVRTDRIAALLEPRCICDQPGEDPQWGPPCPKGSCVICQSITAIRQWGTR